MLEMAHVIGQFTSHACGTNPCHGIVRRSREIKGYSNVTLKFLKQMKLSIMFSWINKGATRQWKLQYNLTYNLTTLWIFLTFFRPGFVRLNLPYFMSHDAVEFVLKAVEMVAEHGWMLLPQVTGLISYNSFY